MIRGDLERKLYVHTCLCVQAVEKVELLRRFGAEVEVVKTAAIANPNHYCRVAQRRAEEVGVPGCSKK